MRLMNKIPSLVSAMDDSVVIESREDSMILSESRCFFVDSIWSAEEEIRYR